jgi:urease accessory protein
MINQSNWHGKINLIYKNNNNKTELSSSFSQSPFKIQQSFYPEGNTICHNVILHTAGGMVGGDRLSQNIHLNENAQSLITTPAASKIYRSNGKIALQNINITLENDSILEYLPQEMIIFDGAKYNQHNIINLQDNSKVFLWDIVRFGRTARGEIFKEGNWQSKLEILHQEKPLYIDNIYLEGEQNLFNNLSGLNGNPILGTLIYVGEIINSETLNDIRQLCQNSLSNGESGVTELIKGISCRYLGNSTMEVKNLFFQIWQLLRLQYLGKNALKLRVW